MHFSALAQAADKYKFCWVCFCFFLLLYWYWRVRPSVCPSTHPLNLSFSHWTLICYSCLWINNILYIWTQLWVSLHINSANTNTHIKTCHLQKSKTFWHLSFFLMASGFFFSFSFFQNWYIYNRPCALGCRVPLAKPLLSIHHTGMLVLSLWKCRHSTNNKANVLSFAAPVFKCGLRPTSEVSPTDLLVNCAITRSTNLSISCHISNVDWTIGWGTATGHRVSEVATLNDLLARVTGTVTDDIVDMGLLSGMVREVPPLGEVKPREWREGRVDEWVVRWTLSLNLSRSFSSCPSLHLRARSRCSGGRWAARVAQWAYRASCSWSPRAACREAASRWASSLPGERKTAARWPERRRCAGRAGAGGDVQSGLAGWGTGSLHTPPGRTGTSPGCSPRGQHLTAP